LLAGHTHQVFVSDNQISHPGTKMYFTTRCKYSFAYGRNDRREFIRSNMWMCIIKYLRGRSVRYQYLENASYIAPFCGTGV
jgi:hypothetical protein